MIIYLDGRHATGEEKGAWVRAYWNADIGDIGPQAAATIAAEHQAPKGPGHLFARALARAGVPHEDLLEAIAEEADGVADTDDLDALRDHVEARVEAYEGRG